MGLLPGRDWRSTVVTEYRVRKNLGAFVSIKVVKKGLMIDSACLTRMHSDVIRCNAIMRGDVIERL